MLKILALPLKVFILISLCLLSCEAPEAPDSQFSAQKIEETDIAAMTELAVGDNRDSIPPLATLDGTWVHLSEVSTCVDLGNSIEQINRSLYLVQSEQQSNGALIEHWEACEIELTPIITIQASVPEALRQSVYPIETHNAQSSGVGLSRRYSSGPLVELWGLTMEEATTDPFPTEADDQRILDLDADGYPGVTLFIGGACEAYLAQRRVTHFIGRQVAFGRLEGEALSNTEQLIIDASSPICKTPYQTRSNPERNRWVRERVDGVGGARNYDLNADGVVSCDEIRLATSELFEVMTPDDQTCRIQ